MKLVFALFLGCLLFSLPVDAQEIWGLEKCIRTALDNSLVIKQYKLNQQGYAITGKQLRLQQLPNLNANTNFGLSIGRVINPVTNDFETENSYYQSIGLNAGLLVFDGLRLRNSIRQNNVYEDAASFDTQQAEEDLSLNVALAYLNVLFAYENFEIAQKRVDLSHQELDRLTKLIDAGSRPETDKFDMLSQSALDEQDLVKAQNDIETNLLSLKQQMWIEPDYNLEIERPELNMDELEALENQTLDAVYNAAINFQPQIKSSEQKEKASELGVDIARSQFYPSLSIGGDISTNWSDFAKEVNGYNLVRVQQPGVYINGQSALFEYDTEIPTGYNSIPYFSQLDNNTGYGLGASLRIPIFNNNSTRANVEKAKINVINSSIETDKIKQNLKTTIQNALSMAKASRKSLDAANASAAAAKSAFDVATHRADLGMISNYDFLSARSRYDNALSSQLIAKYDYYFRIKVIEYYLGRGITLD